MHMVVECIIGLCIDLKSLKNTLEEYLQCFSSDKFPDCTLFPKISCKL